jgi:hypothetical protein
VKSALSWRRGDPSDQVRRRCTIEDWCKPKMTELRLVAVLVGMLTLPGWMALTFHRSWQQWRGLQRWIVAVGISIAFYPVFFYSIRSLFPFLTLGPYKMSGLLFVCAAVVGWRMRKDWREQLAFDRLEWLAIGILGITLFTRFWIIRDRPYPAWSDSLHHTLLTQLTAVQGHLPFEMDPYAPISLSQSHLGLYSLSATVQWLAQVPAHSALLWMSQVLNGLCGLGVYLVLDRKTGRLGAVVGSLVVGLLSHQPAFYVNWGRFPQGASQAILLIAWLVTWEAIGVWRLSWAQYRARILWNTFIGAVLTGAVFLLHFRVAAFYIPLLALSVVWELWQARLAHQVGPVLLGTLIIGIVALLVVSPALWEAWRVYGSAGMQKVENASSEVAQTIQNYYEFPWESVLILGVRPWLAVLACLSCVVGLLRRSKLVVACLLWVVVLYLLGSAYILGIPILSVTNLGGVLIMLYLPVGLVIGCAAGELLALVGAQRREAMIRITAVFALVTGFVASHVRVAEVETHRYFVTPGDVAAMDWIRKNTPQDALFAVNTYFWLPAAPHGTDAGYWIPYFTGRQTTVSVMLALIQASDYRSSLVEMSQAVEQLEIDNSSLPQLQAMGVDYIYIGEKGDFSGPGLDAVRLAQAEDTTVIYQSGGVSILEIGSRD